jgi:MoxR-like ATPase
MDDLMPDQAEMNTQTASIVQELFTEMHKAVVGQQEMVEMLAVALLARGHVLLEGVPGTAKTLAVRAFSRICTVPFARIQFTPDLMPSDILGTSVFDPKEGQFHIMKGPLFAGLILADEVNRTPPRTQAALLEAMEERKITIDGKPYPLPEPFMVCATQNPIEFEGTYPLPEAQLDRFMLKISVDYPQEQEELAILARFQDGFRSSDLDTAHIQPILTPERIQLMQQEVSRVQVNPAVQQYIVQIVRTARQNRHLILGPSPRAAVTLMLAAKALAAIRGRSFVTPDDVKTLTSPIFRHRLILKPESEIEGYLPDRILETVLSSVTVPR